MDELPDLPELVDKIQEFLDMGLFDEALKLLDSTSVFYQNEWEIFFLYSRVYLEQNDPSTAIGYLQKSLKIDSSNLESLLGLFYAFSQLGHLKKSAKYLFRAEKYHPDSEPVLSGLIWYYTEINELGTALGYFEKARKIGIENPETFRNAGIAFERTGNYNEAEKCFTAALRLNPHFDDVRDLLADHYILIDHIENAITLYREHLKSSPNNVRTLSRLIFCLSQNDQPDEAIALAKETIRLYPNSPVGYVDCAYVYLNMGKMDETLEYANKALDVSPLDAEALRVKGIAHSEKNENTEARKDFEAALRLDPKNPEIMRDFYHHCKHIGEFSRMEKLVNRVIKQEYPYCIEDFWFLADYYRETGDNLKAFHFLHRAYTSMPAEKELIPPMLNILIDSGHLLFSVPFMKHYIEKSGWNETMNQFARHRRFQGKWAAEGLRFLRFYGQNSAEYRRYIFIRYFEKYSFIGICMLFLLGLAVGCVTAKVWGALIACAGFAFLLGVWWGMKVIVRKRMG
jgi:tetratricopeptide (TPR) repeat protein